MKTIRLVLTFYKNFAFVSLLLTGLCLWIVFDNGWGTFSAVFWLKVITTGLIFWFINGLKSAEFYYFQNLGLSKTKLWGYSLGLDWLIFTLSFYFLV